MSEEEIKEIAREEMLDTIKSKLDSSMIFTYINNLEQENKQLKKEAEWNNKEIKHTKKIIIKNIKLLTELEEWLKEKINYIVNYIDKSKVKPYGEELRMLENCANRYNDVLDKIQELKEKYK